MTDILKIKKWLNDADAILIGAGAGLSEAAGIHYSGEKFEKDFQEFIKKYGIHDLYTSSFYPFKSEEERWAYWAKHIYFSYYETKHTELYEKLYKLVQEKDYFVITTNTDGQFENNGFLKENIFEVQGSYAKWQCSLPCHDKLYDNEQQVKEMLKNIDEDLKIPSKLVPKCPLCGNVMTMNLRCDETFVEDENWRISAKRYEEFLKKYEKKKVVLLELGVGYNTPGIIRYPFEKMTYFYEGFQLIRLNKREVYVPKEIQEKTITSTESIEKIVDSLIDL